MRLSRSSFVIGTAIALLQAQVAHAQANAAGCLNETEVNALVGYALPSVIDGAMTACRPHLAPTGFFATRGSEFAGRYASRRVANWPGAKSAFLKLGSAKDPSMSKTIGALPDSALQPFVDAMVSELVGDEIKPGQCIAIERGVRILSPLPAENTAELITFVLVLSDKPKPGKASAIPICKVAN